MASISMNDVEHRRRSNLRDLTHAAPMQSPEPLLKELHASMACFCISVTFVQVEILGDLWQFVKVYKVVTDWEEERACSTYRRTSSLALSGFLRCDLIFSCLIKTHPFVLTPMSAQDGFLSTQL